MSDSRTSRKGGRVAGSGGPVEPNGDRPGSLFRGAAVVRAVARHSRSGASLLDLVAETQLPRATLHRILDALGELGWVERDGAGRRYYLGAEFARLGLTAGQRHSIAQLAAVDLAVIAEDLEQAVYLTVRSGLDSVCVAREEGPARIKTLVIGVGSREPLGLGAGSLALLSALPTAEADRIADANLGRYRLRPSFDEETFRDALKRARETGVAKHDGLFTKGVSGIGVAISGDDVQPLAGLSTAFVGDWVGAKERRRFEATLIEGGNRIARRLTGVSP